MTAGHVFIATSLDGFIAREDGDIGWLIDRDTTGEDHGYLSFIENIDGIVMGRGSYEKAVSFDPWPYDKPVVVLTSSLTADQIPPRLRGKVRFVNASPRDVMEQLAQEGWRHAYVDGGKVIQSFLRCGLVEDMVIATVPVLIGSGLPLFGVVDQDISLRHIETKSFPSGLVQSKYCVIQ